LNLEELPDLSKSEYAVLQVLWKCEEQSVRELHDQLDNDWAYSTTKTVMDRMVKKDLLSRRNLHGAFIYQAQVSRISGMAKIVRFFADKVLNLDYGTVVSMFAQSKSYTQEELEQLKDILEQQEANDKTSIK